MPGAVAFVLKAAVFDFPPAVRTVNQSFIIILDNSFGHGVFFSRFGLARLSVAGLRPARRIYGGPARQRDRRSPPIEEA